EGAFGKDGSRAKARSRCSAWSRGVCNPGIRSSPTLFLRGEAEAFAHGAGQGRGQRLARRCTLQHSASPTFSADRARSVNQIRFVLRTSSSSEPLKMGVGRGDAKESP